MSPGQRSNDQWIGRLEDTFPSVIYGTIGYGKVGNEDVVLPGKAGRISREQRKMRHGSTHVADDDDLEREEELRKAKPVAGDALAKYMDMIDNNRGSTV